MKSLIHPLIVLTIVLAFFSCDKTTGEGTVISKELDISNFQGVEMPGAEDVKITQGSEYKVIVTGDYNIVNKIKPIVNAGILTLGLEPGNYSNYSLSYRIVAPDISMVIVSGSGDIEIRDFENQYNLRPFISGSGNIKVINYYGRNVYQAIITGSGNIATYQDHQSFKRVVMDVYGSGNFYGYNFRADTVQISNNGSGNVETYVLHELTTYISGSGNVYYKGNPRIITNITGSGKLINAN